MNVNALNQSVMTQYQQRLKRKAETSEVNLQVNNSSSGYATIQQDDFASRIWNMTDSMPRENQISFTATVLANRISDQNTSDETKSFLKNISNRFSAEEIGTLKNEIMNNPKIQSADAKTVSDFMNSLDELMSDKAEEALQSQLKDQNQYKYRSMDEIFFQTTLNFDATRKGLFNMGDQEAINYSKA